MFSRGLILISYFFCFAQCKDKETTSAFSKEKILRQLDVSIDEHPFNDSLYYVRAHYYYQRSNYKAAQDDLNYAIKLDSLTPDYYHLLADAYIDDGQSFQALMTMQHASILFPDRIPTLLKLCEFQNILKQQDQSLQTIRHILQLESTNAQAYLMSGINLRDLSDTAGAIHSLIKATGYDDRLLDAWIILGQLTMPKDIQLAKTYLENALRIDSNNINTLHSYAEMIQPKDPVMSLNLYQKIIGLDPKYTDAYLNSGIIWFSLDSFSNALNHFNLLCQIEPTEPYFYYYRGTVKEAMSEKEAARADFEQALRLNPNLEEAKKALSTLK